MKHTLKTRHIMMIALGSAIGTGLFFGAGKTIALAGPAILLSYLIGGIIIYIVIRALGEMAVNEPNVGSFSFYAYKYLGDYAGFISGWNYWFNYIIVSMIELTATGIFMDYWFPSLPHWITTLILLLFFGSINLLQVKFFGEFEFWFTGIKVTTIIALIIFGIYLIFFDHDTKQNSITNISNLWQYGGFFATGIKGFILSFVIVVFSFGGFELIGTAAGESKDPQKAIPLAINGIIVRIIIFYIATMAIIMCLYPWNKISSQISPFVDVFQKIGITKAASLMNLIAITAALSSLNSGIYGTARMMYNLGQQRNAPSFVTKISNNGIPRNSLYISLICIFLTIILNRLYPNIIFNVLIAIATAAAIINWSFILITHIAFKRHLRNTSNKLNKGTSQYSYQQILYPFSSIIAIIFFIVVIIAMSQIKDMKLAIYITPVWLILLSIGYYIKSIKRTASHEY